MTRSSGSKQKGLQKSLMFLFLAAFFSWLGISFVNNMLVPQLIDLENPRYGIIQDRLECKGTLIYSEKVIKAPQRGKIKFLIDQGERVRLGTQVAQVTAATIETSTGEKIFTVKAPLTGLVTYHIDGLEQVLTPKSLNELELTKVEKLKGTAKESAQGEEVEKGQIIGKIIDNLESVYIYAQLEKGAIDPKYLEIGKFVQLQMGKNTELDFWKVIEVKLSKEADLLILENRRFQEPFLNNREVAFGIVKTRFEGYIIPEKALVKKGKEPGVYIKHKNTLRWRPVEVVGSIDGNLAIKGLAPETQFVTNPSLAREGQLVQ